MIFILIHSFTRDLRLLSDIVVYWPLQNAFHSFGFERQYVYDACNYLLNGTFPFGLSCFPNQSMISIGVFSGDCIKDTRPEKIVCISLPHTKCNFIHLIQDFVLCTCIQCFMHINQKYILKIHICRFIFKEFTNNPAFFSLFSTVDTALCDTVCQWLAAGWWFSPCTPVSSTKWNTIALIL